MVNIMEKNNANKQPTEQEKLLARKHELKSLLESYGTAVAESQIYHIRAEIKKIDEKLSGGKSNNNTFTNAENMLRNKMDSKKNLDMSAWLNSQQYKSAA